MRESIEDSSLSAFLLPGFIHTIGNEANKIRLLAEYGSEEIEKTADNSDTAQDDSRSAESGALDLSAVGAAQRATSACREILSQVDDSLIETVYLARALASVVTDTPSQRSRSSRAEDRDDAAKAAGGSGLSLALRILRVSCQARGIRLSLDIGLDSETTDSLAFIDGREALIVFGNAARNYWSDFIVFVDGGPPPSNQLKICHLQSNGGQEISLQLIDNKGSVLAQVPKPKGM